MCRQTEGRYREIEDCKRKGDVGVDGGVRGEMLKAMIL